MRHEAHGACQRWSQGSERGGALDDRLNEFTLEFPWHGHIGFNCSRKLLMPEVLRPGFVLVQRFADIVAQHCEGLAEAVWRELGQPGAAERRLRYRNNL